MTFEGNPDEVKVLSINEKLKDIKVTHKPKSDSVKIWFDAVKSDIGQTVNEKLEFSYDTGAKQDTVVSFYKYNKKNVMDVISENGGSLLPPKTDFKISSTYLIDKINPEKWTLKIDSTIVQPFTAKISQTNPYQILITSDFVSGKKYQLTIPKTTISSYYDKNSESKRFDFEVDKIENYGNLSITLENAPTKKYWLQLLDSSEKAIYQVYSSGNSVMFDVLKPAEYIIRILVDNNENGYWDPADFETSTFAEDSYTYYKTAVIRPLWTSKETWDLKDTRVLDISKFGTATSTTKGQAGENKSTTNPSNNSSIQNTNSGTRDGNKDLQLRR